MNDRGKRVLLDPASVMKFKAEQKRLSIQQAVNRTLKEVQQHLGIYADDKLYEVLRRIETIPCSRELAFNPRGKGINKVSYSGHVVAQLHKPKFDVVKKGAGMVVQGTMLIDEYETGTTKKFKRHEVFCSQDVWVA